ncbi:MAG: PAC2 family protein [Pirellulaceae bacterium]
MQASDLERPIMVAAWPGMGHVALTAAYYLMAKLEMKMLVEYQATELFDVDHVAVNKGLVQPFRYPKSQFFGWKNPGDGPDMILFIGEAQPPLGRYNFCRKLIDYAQQMAVSKVVTFAAFATNIGLSDQGRVVAAAIDHETLGRLVEKEVHLLSGGNVSGMNGILLGVAAERHMSGGCLLGELPHMFAGVPYPKASLNVLQMFSKLTDLEIDLSELVLEADRIQQHLTEAVSQLKHLEQRAGQHPESEEETFLPDPLDVGKLSEEDQARLDLLFGEAELDRSKAYELKRLLDELGVFREYEDRFLDLFTFDDETKDQEPPFGGPEDAS